MKSWPKASSDGPRWAVSTVNYLHLSAKRSKRSSVSSLWTTSNFTRYDNPFQFFCPLRTFLVLILPSLKLRSEICFNLCTSKNNKKHRTVYQAQSANVRKSTCLADFPCSCSFLVETTKICKHKHSHLRHWLDVFDFNFQLAPPANTITLGVFCSCVRALWAGGARVRQFAAVVAGEPLQ